ncbi:MAG: hypothetical protein ACI9YH_003317 [Colwellia sp.]|jgi:hypothetical protein
MPKPDIYDQHWIDKRAIHLEQPVSICSDEQRIQITQSRH